jgi:hypothetical protein
VASSPASTFGTILRIAVPGGSIVPATLPGEEDVPTVLEATPARQSLLIGAPRTVEIALPAMTGPEIVFDLSTENFEGCGQFPRPAGYLLDDLRVD